MKRMRILVAALLIFSASSTSIAQGSSAAQQRSYAAQVVAASSGPSSAASAAMPATSPASAAPSNAIDTPSPWALITATGALLAFLIGLFTLVGRERKAPYLINSVFLVFLVCLIGIAFDIAAIAAPSGSRVRTMLIYIGCAFLAWATLLSTGRVYKLYVRFVLFIDSANPRHWSVSRWISDFYRSLKKKKPYEHETTNIDKDFQGSIAETLAKHREEWVFTRQVSAEQDVASCAVAVDHQGQANQILVEIASTFLEKKYCVQYMAAARHPIDFVERLKEHVSAQDRGGNSWVEKCRRVIVIDAYTPHFGFTDSIYRAATRRLEREFQVKYVISGPTYAGLHTASSVAFNLIRKQSKAEVREPVLIIYEDCSALADLESTEQYRVFVRHVVPSEKMWGGMFTICIETNPSASDWGILKSYTGLVLDARAASSKTEKAR